MSPLFTLSVTLFGKRVELEAYPCAALYVRLGSREWFLGGERAMKLAER